MSEDNFIQAEHNARRGKTNTYGVKRFDKRSDLTLLSIIKSLKNNTYKTSKYHIFKIYEPKERIIYQLPYYPDRIVHHALMNVLEPIFVKWFIANTYSCIKNRGIHKLAQDIERCFRKHKEETTWCLKLDIKKFYPSISREILFTILLKKIKDKLTIGVLKEIIYSVESGVPIGNYLSLFFANIYLTDIDHWIKEVLKVKWYYRYCDDIVIFGNDKHQLYKIYRLIGQKLSFIKLHLKSPKLFPTDKGVDFVGYIFRHSYTLLRKQIKIRFKRTVKKYINSDRNIYKQHIASYYGWLAHCDGIHLLKQNINDLYYDFKKHYFKNCGVRTIVMARRGKNIAK